MSSRIRRLRCWWDGEHDPFTLHVWHKTGRIETETSCRRCGKALERRESYLAESPGEEQ